jgi:hypothetical protein
MAKRRAHKPAINLRRVAAKKGWATRRRREAEKAAEARKRRDAAIRGAQTRKWRAAAKKGVITRRRHEAEKVATAARRKQTREAKRPPAEPEIIHIFGDLYSYGGVTYFFHGTFEEFAKTRVEDVKYRKTFAEHIDAAKWVKATGISGIFTVVHNTIRDTYFVYEIPSGPAEKAEAEERRRQRRATARRGRKNR